MNDCSSEKAAPSMIIRPNKCGEKSGSTETFAQSVGGLALKEPHAGSEVATSSSVVSDSVLSSSDKLSYESGKSHHGSTTSTTFSTGSAMSSSTTNDPVDYSSTASSGVATMSSTDNIPTPQSSSTRSDASLNVGTSPEGCRNLLKASSSTPQAAAAGNSSTSTLSLNTASVDSTMCSTRANMLRSASPTSNSHLNTSGNIPRNASNKSVEGLYMGSSNTDRHLTENANGRQPTPTSPARCSIGEGLPSNNSTSTALTNVGSSIANVASPSKSAVQSSPSGSYSMTSLPPMTGTISGSSTARRYQQDGFNLDLTYITDRIIAMGYPADTTEALYRNSMTHIVKFLEHYHPGHYKVFNLRGQYVYDTSKFHNRVVSFEMTDHHPPRLELMAPFCREVHDYLETDPRNVVAVHCKAGKGRTGVMICAYLTYISFYKTPRQNMDYYSIVRTHNNKGVTIPSQRRYVYYFSHLRNKKLNYMPLRTELIGVYVEKPPKLSGPFLKGALKVRVANGDVDVFLGDDMWLNTEKSEEDDEMHRKYPILSGEDQYDPSNPQSEKDCISRRCYGWTVPSNKRVFLEGDVRIDLFQKSQLKVLNVKQDRKKIGHIWMNTMFTCPGFCGGNYMHGDEAYPYPNGESMIVKRRLRKKVKCDEPLRQASDRRVQSIAGGMPNSSSMPSSPPLNKFHDNVRISVDHSTTNSVESVPSSQTTATGSDDNTSSSAPAAINHMSRKSSSNDPKKTSKMALRLNGITKKRRSPCHHLMESENKCWSSQDGELGPKSKNSIKDAMGCRASLDNENEYEEELVVEAPPGLEEHCPLESLKEIYSNEKQAPRHGIVDILRVAYQKNLIHDLYNARRFSVPKEGAIMPKAPVGRPNADGPYCVMREPEEHVGVYGVQEIDRAHKAKELDMAFKVYIVTRCINESNATDVKLSESFLRTTYYKQMKKDEAKREKVELRQKKLFSQQGYSNLAHTNDESSGSGAGSQFTDSSSSSSQFSSVPDLSPQSFQTFLSDPRSSDPHLKKFFFRQRISSKSRHPAVHYHCSAQVQDPAVCSKYGCSGRRRTRNTLKSSSITDRPPLYVDNEADNEDDMDATCFDDFDFFKPTAGTSSTSEGEGANSTTGDEETNGASSSGDTPVDTSSLTVLIPTRSQTMTSATVDQRDFVSETLKQTTRSRSARSAIAVDKVKKDSANHFESMPTAPELLSEAASHPSDCSWASSSSSTSSSSHSLDHPLIPSAESIKDEKNSGTHLVFR
ncbi:c2 domain of PTEN tumor-suppressor protein [Ditylenchus destructor]|nr:c2 domain of PTEN tumor-suppressor protein [Ditylenchus destructor]